MELIRRVVAGSYGGAVGGALVGLAEACVVALGADAQEFWAFFFGAVSYGLIGALCGAGWGFFSGLVRLHRSRAATFATAAGLAAAGLGAVVARFRIIRDVFAENLPLATSRGVMVHLGLAAAAIVTFFLVHALLGRSAAKRGPVVAGLRWTVGLVASGLVASVALTLVLGGSSVAGRRPTSADGPNLVLVIVDTLRADRLGAYGSTSPATPGIDALASDGVVFEKAFAHSSWTRPSIATILTSLYPSSHKVMHKTDLLPDAVTTIAEVLRHAGYRTAGFVTNINVAPSFNFQQGFDSYTYLSPAFFFGATDSGAKLSLYSGMRLVRERFLSSKKYVEHYYQDGETVNRTALPWLDDNAREPFFTLVHYMDPHDPYFDIPYDGKAVARVDTPDPAPSRAGELAKLYDSNVAYVDRFVGDLMQELKSAGVYDNTVIALVADHGEEFYEHKGWWHGTTLYDEEIHVPLIVKLPKSAHAGLRVKDLAGTIDVAPTLVASAGVAIPPAFQGRDLFGKSVPPDLLYAEEDFEGNVLESVRGQGWKLIIANPGNPRGLAPAELYDLNKDPGETYNLAVFKQKRVADMREQLAAMHKFAGARAVDEVSGRIDKAAEERLKALGYIQ